MKHKKAIWGKLRKSYENLGGSKFADNINFKKNIFRNYILRKRSWAMNLKLVGKNYII